MNRRARSTVPVPTPSPRWSDVWSTARTKGSLRDVIRQLRKASARDDSAAAYLAMLYREGVVGDDGDVLLHRNARTSLAYAQRAADEGNVSGLLELADSLDSSKKPRSVKRARRIYVRLARGNYTTAMLHLAVSYERDGRHRHAVRWLRKAAQRGDASARIELAKATFFGIGTRRDATAALQDLVALATRERIDVSPFSREQCLLFVGLALLEGWGLPRDYEKACGYIRQAAKLGSEAAAGLLRDLGL